VIKSISKLQILLIFTLATITITPAFAQSAPIGDGVVLVDVISATNLAVIASSFVLGGIGWAILGWQKNRRVSKSTIDYKKLAKTVITGVLVGIASLVYMVYTDSSIENLHIVTFHGYVSLTMWAFSIVVTTVVVLKKLFPDLFGYSQDKQSDNQDTQSDPIFDVPEEEHREVPP